MHSVGTYLLKALFRAWVGADRSQFFASTDWPQASAQFQQPQVIYPDYYSSQNFHGIVGGYLNPIAAITYDPVTAIASPPSETRIRQQTIRLISGQPQRILDLGCGTGTMTLLLKQTFPFARIWGVDLSPYMLVLANYKAHQAQLEIQWQHGLAETTEYADAAFDLITVAFLLHETPPSISQRILKECFRLLKSDGQLIILDGHQAKLRQLDWLIHLFREPYSKAYAAESVETWLQQAEFTQIQTQSVGWINQIFKAIKP